MLKNLKKFLNGEYPCRYCGKDFKIMSFGYGECICPSCYDGEDPFIFPDNDYVLNRVWGLIAFKDMTGNQLAQFIDELSEAAIALSIEGFKVTYQLADAPEEPVISIRRAS